MADIEVSQEIDAPLATVWELLIDVARLPEILSGVQAVQVAGGGDLAMRIATNVPRPTRRCKYPSASNWP